MEVIGDNQVIIYGYNSGVFLVTLQGESVTTVKKIKEGK